MQGFFITGTDTGVGKTHVSCVLLHQLQQRGLMAVGLKPVASGAVQTSAGLRNEDVLLLQHHSSCLNDHHVPDYEALNVYTFAAAVAPHIAAAQQGVEMQLEPIVKQAKSWAPRVDCMLVEGVGGWLVPLNSRQTLADVAIELQLPVILVVGLRLGCLNHALLSQQAIVHSGLPVAGWVANQIEPDFSCLQDNLQTLSQRLSAPCLGVIPYHLPPSPLNAPDLLASMIS